MNKILIVDANPYHLSIMFGLLEKAGYEPVTADSMKKGKGGGGKTATRRCYCISY